MVAPVHVPHSSLPRYSIVVLNYNNAKLTCNCVESIFKSNYDLSKVEVIVIDNNSTTPDTYLLYPLKCQKVFNNKNLFYTGGNNQGIMLSRGDYIIILNNDTIVDKDWLNEIDKTINKDLSIGIAQPKILQINSNKLDSSIPKIRWFWRGHCVGIGETDNNQYDNETIDYACGACMVLSRYMLSEIGLFDNMFGMHCEDMDLSIRAKKYGYKVIFVPNAKIWHIRQATMKNVNRLIIKWYILKNRILLTIKHRRIK